MAGVLASKVRRNRGEVRKERRGERREEEENIPGQVKKREQAWAEQVGQVYIFQLGRFELHSNYQYI